MRAPRMRHRVGAVAVGVLVIAGCGSSSSPAQDVPALARALSRVDDAIVAGRYEQARSELNGLVATTTDAREAGDLEASEADRILAAAAQVLTALPAARGSDPLPSPPDGQGDGEKDEEQQEEQQEQQQEDEKEKAKDREDELEKLEEEREKKDDGGGNGDSSGHGPDDGEGN